MAAKVPAGHKKRLEMLTFRAPAGAANAFMSFARMRGARDMGTMKPPEVLGLRLFRPDKPAIALGLAVNYLMTKPAFAKQPFGPWSKILVGQINRGHYCFVADAANKIQGFVGWALTSRSLAEAWIDGRPLTYEESLAGECVVFNAWSANSTRVHRFMVEETRKLVKDKDTLYFQRHYADGSTRPGRITINDFVAGHIERKAALGTEPLRGDAPSPAASSQIADES